MKMSSRCRPAWALCLVAVVASVVAVGPAGAAERNPLRRMPSAAEANDAEASVIVKFKADAGVMRAQSASGAGNGPQAASALSTRLGMKLVDGHVIGPHSQVVKASGVRAAQLAAQLAAQSDVEYAVVDGRKRALAAPNDPLYAAGQPTSPGPAVGQWYLQAPNATIASAINLEAAWAVSPGTPNVVVADLDTGVRFDHPDLAVKLVPGYNFITSPGAAGNGVGRSSDASDLGDYVTQSDVNSGVPGCLQSDVGSLSSWHGTQTAGIIGAATNNGVGMAGIGNVTVQPVRVLGKCGGADSDIIAAMLWAGGLSGSGVSTPNPYALRVRAINMSLGSSPGTPCNAAYQDAIDRLWAAGIVVVVAGGNEGVAPSEPANCNHVVAVGGVRQFGTKVGYSSLGPGITISAPAGNCINTGTGQPCLYPILSTTNTGSTTPVAGSAGATYTNGTTDPAYGTSYSTPMVTGTVALIASANPRLTPAQMVSALQSTARPFPSSGAGLTQHTDTGPMVPVAACASPDSVADQTYECYCTTSTCGAGMLDAGLATAAAAATHASIAVSASTVEQGGGVTLDGTGSWAGASATSNLNYQWSISSGGSLVTLSNPTAAAPTLTANGVGSVVIALTVTDSVGGQSVASSTVTIVAPASSGGGGGGGAMELGWLLGWLASVIGVRVVTPRTRRG